MNPKFIPDLPDTGKRQQITSHVAMIVFPGRCYCCVEVKDGNPDATFPPMPLTYTLRRGDRTAYYFTNTPRFEKWVRGCVLD
jgi:hypothetical protein